ncbi:MAG: molybdopterin molybdotransferase MoeA [Chloroflexi bacterium]|nr:molybdopterin molybdotransferase MoeA [Chloroflexota bacterium]
MITVEQALAKVLSYVNVLEAETRPILDTLGQVLVEDIRSAVDIPPWDNSAMDGYALRAADTTGAGAGSPRVLRVIGTVPAGVFPDLEVKPGTAIRIMTGAPMPRGADAVVRFENTDEERRPAGSNEIGILCEASPGQNIRRAGEDIARGALVLKRGTVLRPAEVGVLASLGYPTANVIRRPLVAMLATGDELVEIGQPLTPGKIYNSNSYGIAAEVARYGGIPRVLGIAQDRETSLISSLRRGLEADMLITSGGVSMGDYDIVKDVLAKEGEITFWTVRMKPGKPLAFGTIKGTDRQGKPRNIPHLGLPGNPVSAMITFELFARPAILKMLGKQDFTKPTITAVLESPVENSDGRRVYARAIVEKRDGQYVARTTGPQGSGILTSMAMANGLVIVPEDRSRLNAGEAVQVMMLDWSEQF